MVRYIKLLDDMKSDIATISDIESLINLLGFLFEQETEFSPNTELQYQGLKKIIENPQYGEILVVRDNGQAIAMVNLLYTISTAMGGEVVTLEDMIVHPDYRNRGIGSQLIDAAIQHAQVRGCGRITLLTDADNSDAHRFYIRQGFQPSSMQAFRLFLPDARE